MMTVQLRVCSCMTAERQKQLSVLMESLVDRLSLVEERRTTVDRQSSELTAALDAVSVDRQRLCAERRAFNGERQAFAEELVRINTVNKIHDTYIRALPVLVVVVAAAAATVQ